MGKQQKRDKLYITREEWARDFGGAKQKKINNEYKRLPFWDCSLTLTPFEHPVCTKEGIIFDLVNIIPWIKKHGTNPVNNEKLETKDLIKLNFAKSAAAAADGSSYHCPITLKTFNEHTHIVAIKQTGNVYSYDAVKSLNIDAKNWKDLLTDEPFMRKDIISLQDPHNLGSTRNINEFYYMKHDLKLDANLGSAIDTTDTKVALGTNNLEETSNINASGSLSRVLSEVSKKSITSSTPEVKPPITLTASFVSKQKPSYNDAHYSTGAASSSLTSTASTPQLKNTPAKFNKEEFMFASGRIKKNALAQIRTNLGDINVELFVTDVPKTSYNFIMLAKSGYYKDVKFHRSIKNFMIQGGDPTGTGKGGESYWKRDFEDEFKQNLTHTGRGIISMANRGKDTNSSQFFITFKSCNHLDNKHTIFGKVVGGLETLSKMEKVPTDDHGRPVELLKIQDVIIFVDPFKEFEMQVEAIESKEEALRASHNARAAPRPLPQPAKPSLPALSSNTSIGKYLLPAASTSSSTIETQKRPVSSISDDSLPERKKIKPTIKNSFGNFDNW